MLFRKTPAAPAVEKARPLMSKCGNGQCSVRFPEIESSEQDGEGTEAFSHSSVSTVLTLPKPLLKSMPKIYQERIEPLDLRFNTVRREDYNVSVKRAQKKVLSTRRFAKSAKASICFIVKRPGCLICKEQGMMLQELVNSFPGDRVAAWAVIKEIDVDNEGLLELYRRYFNFPFFLDTKMAMYKAMGKKMINPFKFFNNVKKGARERIANKGIEGTFVGKGEGLVLGGVIIFDAKGNIQYAYQEKSGAEELPVEEFRVALNAIIDGQKLH